MKKLRIILLCLMMVLLVACASGEEKKEVNKKPTIIFTDAGWESMRVNNEIASFILNKGYGYDTDITSGSSAACWLGQKRGDINVNIETWSDNIGDYNDTISSGDIVEIGLNMKDNIQGIYVPDYVIYGDEKRGIKPMAPDLKYVEDLSKYKDLFKDDEAPNKGRIYNAPAVWMVAEIIEKKINNYNLTDDYNLFGPGSSAALFSSIASAYEKGQPWVGYCWEPTWITGKYKLIRLKEKPFSEKLWAQNYSCEFKPSKVTVTVHKNLKEDAPDAIEFLSKYDISSKDLAKTLLYIQEKNVSPKEAALYFIKNNEDIWNNWVNEEVFMKVKNSIK